MLALPAPDSGEPCFGTLIVASSLRIGFIEQYQGLKQRFSAKPS
tara:strand:- start:1214 stop:1345 length:132 start_codon:yes stop_codon:yes gene_type:complete